MATIDDALKCLKDNVPHLIKDQIKDLLTSAQNDADSVIKETGQKVTDWLFMLSEGKLSVDEFKDLLYSRDQLIRQYKNTLDIQVRAKVEKIALGLINLVLNGILNISPGN